MSTTTLRALGALFLAPTLLTAQRPTLSAAVKQYVAVDTPVVALTHVRVIDGTGAAPKEDQTLIIRDGNIVLLGAARSAGGRARDRPHGEVRDPGSRDDARASLLPDRSGGLRRRLRELLAAVPRGRRHVDADRRQRGRLRRPEPRRGDQGRESGRTLDRRHSALRKRPFPVHPDVRAEGFGRRAPLRGILGGRGRDVVQSIHEHHPGGARRGGGGSA